MLKKIAVTTGEPAGIGADIIVELSHIAFDAAIIVLGDVDLLTARAKAIKVPLQIDTFLSLIHISEPTRPY